MTDDNLYIVYVETMGGGYRECVICGGYDYARGGEGVEHHPACTQEFREFVARTVGYI